MADKPAILLPITITDSNKWIDFDYKVGTYAASIATGEYADINAVLAAIETAMETAAAAGSLDCELTAAVDSNGRLKVTIDSQDTSTFSIDWATGANAANSIGQVLGFDVSANDTGAYTYTSDYQCQGAWVSNRAPASDSFDNPEHVGSDLVMSLDRTHGEVVDVGVGHEREVTIPVMLPALVYADQATGSDLNRDFETQWEAMVGGSAFRYCPDQTALATYTTYYLAEPRKWLGKVRRVGRGVRRHSWSMTFVKKES